MATNEPVPGHMGSVKVWRGTRDGYGALWRAGKEHYWKLVWARVRNIAVSCLEGR